MLSPFWTVILIAAGISAILALGLYVSCSAGSLSAAHAALAGMSGYLDGVLTTNFHWPFAAAVTAGALLGFGAGVFLALATVRMNALVAGLTTLAFGETMVVIALNIDYLGGASSFYGIPQNTTFTVVYAILAGTLILVWRFESSRLGLAARACRDDPAAASASGISVTWVRTLVFAFGAAIAGVAGALSASYVLVVSPGDLSFANSVNVIVPWVVGGSYFFLGPPLAAIGLTILPELLGFSLNERYLLYGLALIAIVVARPQGLIGRVPLGARPRFAAGAHLARLLRRRQVTGGSDS